MPLPAIDINNSNNEWNKDLEFNSDTYDSGDLSNVFVIDWNYMTFHSPDVEFNDSFYNMDTTTLKCKITGKCQLSATQGDIHITTTTPPISPDASGFYHRVTFSKNSSCRINAGSFYRDCDVKYNSTEKKYTYEYADSSINPEIHGFLIYPWHRIGSLNNDCVRPTDDDGSRSAVLDQKKMANLMYFEEMHYNELVLDKLSIDIFNSDQVSLIKTNNKNYFGNIDQVLSPRFKYLIGCFSYEDFKDTHIHYISTGAFSGNWSS